MKIVVNDYGDQKADQLCRLQFMLTVSRSWINRKFIAGDYCN